MRSGHRLVIVWILAVVTPAVGVEQPGLKRPADGVAFNGRTAYAVPAEALALKPKALSVSAWVKLDAIAESQVFLNRGPVSESFTFYLFDKQVRMLIGHQRGGYAHADAPPPKPGEWTHYAGTYDGESIQVFMNGRLVKTAPAKGQMDVGTGKVYIGSLDDHERFVSGRMDDLRIWRRVLSGEEVMAAARGETSASLNRDLAGRWTGGSPAGDAWKSEPASVPAARRIERSEPQVVLNGKDDGYRGIWYMNQPSNDEYVYKYSGGLGTYCANHLPFAWHVPAVKKTFFVYGGTTRDSNQRLTHMVSFYDHETGMVPRPTILLDKKTSDAHDNPVLSIDEKGHLWVFSSSHGRGRPSYISRSKEPHRIDGFDLIWTGNFSYPQPAYLPGHGFLFLHTYYNPGRTVCMFTSPDGVNWSERRLLLSIGEGHYQVSGPMGGGRIGTSFMYHPKGKGVNWRTNLYYMESSDFGKTWKTAGGEGLQLPLTEIVNPALVQEYESKGLLVYIQDITHDAEGRPVILYTTSKGYESGPENGPRHWTTAHWTGSAWEIRSGDILADNNYDTGSIYIEAPDLWRIIGPSQDGPQAFNTGGEVAMWISRDQGKSWKLTRQMTTGSKYNHTYLRRPVNANPDFYGFWADGHARQPSDSRLYFCNQAGDVFRLPVTMSGDSAKPEKVSTER
ncbi:MAG TPA: BNR-4 repeat-containing protein [Phycisphaerae bacterium]|nr:BNR-4 repeat-containing protein [Phycisphaerae bacterium]HRY66373.1 BNR-4 repeat-containing protein [Phycisphaerae bacterium]HSA25920.1 BNR-4 repeat-containing protein [Phycisphaerae bacterium]